METRVLIIVLLVIVLVVGINGGLFLWLKGGRSNPAEHYRLWQKASQRARNPWEKEEADLKELSRLVNQLQGTETAKPDDDARPS
jgi:hypothetical protein